MTLRIGTVPYLNARPLVEGLADQAGLRLLEATPDRLVEYLRARTLDAALVSAIEYFRKDNYRIVPGIAIASRGEVRSIKLFSKVPPPRIRSVAVDRSSRTAAALVRVLLSERYGVEAVFSECPPEARLEAIDADALMLIGDPAMRYKEEAAVVIDLGTAWHAMTHRPFVYALWLVRPEVASENLTLRLQEAKAKGMARVEAIAEREAPRLKLPEADCLDYLRRCIHYDLGGEELEGLRLFAAKAAALDLCEGNREIDFYDPAGTNAR